MIATKKEEIDALREGCRRTARHMRALLRLVTAGESAARIDTKARELVDKDGDTLAFLGYASGERGERFESAICCSVNDVIVHSPAGQNDVRFEEGDVVSLDFGIAHRGFYTDMARTVIVGSARSEDDERLVRGTYEAFDAGCAAARVGNTVGDIGYAVQQVAEKYRFGYPINLCGHGIGRSLHEEPRVPNFGKPGKGQKIVEGLVIAIEPMMTLGSGQLFVDKDGHSFRTKDGSRSAHVENTVLVTKHGPEVLTRE